MTKNDGLLITCPSIASFEICLARMPRVLAALCVRGALTGFSTAELTVRLSVLDDGSMVGVMEPTGWLVETGKAAIDYCESTPTTTVYSCRFTIVHVGHEQATRLECIGRLSSSSGLTGRWRRLIREEDDVVMEIPFHMPLANPTVPRREAQADAPAAVSASIQQEAPVEGIGAIVATEPSPSHSTRTSSSPQRRVRPMKLLPLDGGREVRHEMVFRGNTVDAQGEIYETTLFLTFWDGWKVTGAAHESDRECPVVGTWSGCYVQYRLTYPHSANGTYFYDYEGVIRDDDAGGARLMGTWQFDKEASIYAMHEVLHGTFDFRREGGPPANNTRARSSVVAPPA